MRGLQGKVAIVTGGLGDLGHTSGARLIEEGCKVALFDLKDDTCDLAGKIGASYHKVDIGDAAQVEKACAAVREQLGPVSILVNCAALFIFKGVDATPEEWAAICRVNINGTSQMARFVVPQMRECGGGSIINFSSVSGFVGQPEFATYNATKFAIRGLTKCWAHDLSQHKIRVNAICPGYIHTSAFVNSCRDLGRDVEEENRKVSETHLLGRQGHPEEVAAAVAFLASDESSFMTGSDLLVDGGYLAR
jgi:NAD(P)-dependent dehydrogenase (short-subunit alcohol dehydrogenase family)